MRYGHIAMRPCSQPGCRHHSIATHLKHEYQGGWMALSFLKLMPLWSTAPSSCVRAGRASRMRWWGANSTPSGGNGQHAAATVTAAQPSILPRDRERNAANAHRLYKSATATAGTFPPSPRLAYTQTFQSTSCPRPPHLQPLLDFRKGDLVHHDLPAVGRVRHHCMTGRKEERSGSRGQQHKSAAAVRCLTWLQNT